VQGLIRCLIDLMPLQCRVSEQAEEDNLLIGDSEPVDNLPGEANRSSSLSAAAVTAAGDAGEMSSRSGATDSHSAGFSASVQTSATVQSYGILIAVA